MDNYTNIKNKLLMVKNHVLRMPNTKKKVIMIEGYYQLLYYYSEIVGLNDDEYQTLAIDDEFTMKYDKYVISNNQKMINEIKKNAPYLYHIFKEIINSYQKEGFCSFECNDEIKTNKEKMYELVWNFLASLDKDALTIYDKMIENNNIFLINEFDCFGLSVNSLAIDNPCIIIQNAPKYFDYYITLVHEIGHCYQFYLQRNQEQFMGFNPYSEITSLLFEKLFINYLMDNHILKNSYDYELEDHVYFLNDVSAAKVLCNLFINKNIGNINAYDLSYETSKSKDELLSEMACDCGYIMPNKLNIELDEIHYAIGNMIAIYFNEKLKSNKIHEWKNFKDFLCTVHYLPMSEVLHKYIDLDLINEKIKTFTKSYRER